jgi:hydrogenase maturation protein HypF
MKGKRVVVSVFPSKAVRFRAEVTGVVQGVGFRPFVYREAIDKSLAGWVRNNQQGVLLEVEGEEKKVRAFLAALRSAPLPLARIEKVVTKQVPAQGGSKFSIHASDHKGSGVARIPPDIAMCSQCRDDILSPGNRRFNYPFTNCTNCGPRYTIIRNIPYDRNQTTMAAFSLCPACDEEFHNPRERRFHAQPNACPDCGPQVRLFDKHGRIVPGDWVEAADNLIHDGQILAIKGLGGFHLACNALDRQAINRLRQRKNRPARPFAVMCKDLPTVYQYCHVNDSEKELLTSAESPIVVLRRKENGLLPDNLAPGLHTLGVMLPYTPLHLVLLHNRHEIVVMTSGNAGGLPLVTDNREALAQLAGTADYFLLHNRPIYRRCDDSLVCVAGGEPRLLRRSRGYVPISIPVPLPDGAPEIFGAGGDMKNTFCFLKDGRAFLGPHMGDLSTVEVQVSYMDAAAGMQEMLRARPDLVAFDCHPGYHSSLLARNMQAMINVPVWHHHAHLAACMGENGLTGSVIGVICDGTGFGRDQNIWGGEILSGDYREFQREYHLQPIPLPGGDGAIQSPLRTAAAYLGFYLGEAGFSAAQKIFPSYSREIELLESMLTRNFNAPRTSSCGRLYDAVSALLGICTHNSYDGQAPAELSSAAYGHRGAPYPYSFRNKSICCKALMKGVLEDLTRGRETAEIAASFEATVVAMFAEGVRRVRERSGLNRVVLSGGSFQNPYLLSSLQQQLRQSEFVVYTHRSVPANDGGLALGQVLVAAWKEESR